MSNRGAPTGDNGPPREYSRVGFTSRSVGAFLIYTAEVTLVTRTHRRAILATSGDPTHQGKPLLYSDTYASSSGDPDTFVYARHKCSSTDFFAELNGFLEGVVADNPELARRSFPMLLTAGKDFYQQQIQIPFQFDEQTLKVAAFFRLDLPFGAITVEFGEPIVETGSQLDGIRTNQLVTRLESPLVGVDFTRGEIYRDLLLRIHWASDFLPKSVLSSIISDLAATSVYT